MPLTDAELEHIAEGLKPFVDSARVVLWPKLQVEAYRLMIPPTSNELHLIKYRPKPNTVSAYFSRTARADETAQPTCLRVHDKRFANIACAR